LARLRDYLRSQNMSLPEGYDEALAFCNTAAEVRFLIPIITLPMWNKVGPQSFSNGVHRITVRGFVEGTQVPILFEDMLSERNFAFEVGYRSEYLPGRISAQNKRREEIKKRVFRYYVIPDLQAKRIALGLRADIAREQAAALNKHPQLAKAQLADPKRPRVWLPNPLVYNVSNIAYADRFEILRSWLAAHHQSVTEEGVSWLAFCESAAEIWFGLQMLAFGDIRFDGTRLSIHGSVHVDVQCEHNKQTVDFYMKEWHTIIQIDRPVWYPFDHGADREDDKLRQAGYTVERVEANRALSVGKMWHTRISNSLRNA
jgi:hypothetical protein